MQCSVIVCVLVLFANCCWSKVLPADSSNDLSYNSLLPVGKIFSSCSDSHSLKICLKMRSLMLLEDLTVKGSPINLFGNFLTLVKSSESRTGARMLPESVEELDSTLPKDETQKEETLDKLITTSLEKFVTSRALQIKLPDLSFFSASLEEARKRRKGGLGMGWAFMSAGGMMGALGLGAIALLAGKALTVSMMALLLAAMSAMSGMRKGGGGGGGHASYEVISVPTGHGHHGRRLGAATSRSLVTGVELPEDPELRGAELAYRAYMENNTEPYEKKNN